MQAQVDAVVKPGVKPRVKPGVKPGAKRIVKRGLNPGLTPDLNPDAAATNVAVQALQLLGRWQRVRNGHLALSAGCACSFGASVDLREFDDLILDFLLNKFAADAALCEFVRLGAGALPGQSSSLTLLLRGIATVPATLPAARVQAVLQALEGSIESIEEQHP